MKLINSDTISVIQLMKFLFQSPPGLLFFGTWPNFIGTAQTSLTTFTCKFATSQTQHTCSKLMIYAGVVEPFNYFILLMSNWCFCGVTYRSHTEWFFTWEDWRLNGNEMITVESVMLNGPNLTETPVPMDDLLCNLCIGTFLEEMGRKLVPICTHRHT